jgi:hypothetical protein
MRAKSAIALVPLLVACGVTAGCAAAARPVAGVSTRLNCGMVVDPDRTGYLGGAPLTTSRAVAMLTEPRPAGRAARIASGTLSGTERRTLDIVAMELIGYSGNKLSADAAAFAQAELNYSPAWLPVDTAYARPLVGGIAALERDCPPPAARRASSARAVAAKTVSAGDGRAGAQ